MAVPNKPANPIRDTSAIHDSNIVHLLPFMDGSGSTVTALVGSNFTINGVEAIDFEWEADIGDQIVELLTSVLDSAIDGPTAVGDQVLSAGTIVTVLRLSATETGGYVLGSGRPFSGPAGAGQFAAYFDSLNFGIEYKDPTLGIQSSYLGSGLANGWVPVVIRWNSATPSIEINVMDGVTKRTQSITPGDATGVIIRDTLEEKVGASNSANNNAMIGIGYYMRLNVEITAGEVDSYLANPFLNIKAGVTHDFELSAPLTGDLRSNGVKVFQVAKKGANVGFRVNVTPSAGGTPVAAPDVMSQELASREQLVAEFTGLEPNTEYDVSYWYNKDDAGWVPQESTLSFKTLANTNDDTTTTMVVSDSHDGNKVMTTVAEHLAEIAALEPVIDMYSPNLLIHGGDIHDVGHSYIDYTSVAAAIESCDLFHIERHEAWMDILERITEVFVAGNHSREGRRWQADPAVWGDEGIAQRIHTECRKRFWAQPDESFTPADDEWAVPAELAAEEEWVGPSDGANRPPFQTYGIYRNGPVEFFCLDVGRYSLDETAYPGALSYRLGPSQEAEFKANVLASRALFKVAVIHHPTGGRSDEPSDSAAEAYGRGGVGIADRTQYDWYNLFAWMEENGIDLVLCGHDHVFAIGRMSRGIRRPLFISMGSPTAPFNQSSSLWYARGYNGSTSDPEHGPFDAHIVDGDFECLYANSFKGCIIIEARGGNSPRLLVKFIETYDGAAKLEVKNILEIEPQDGKRVITAISQMGFTDGNIHANIKAGASGNVLMSPIETGASVPGNFVNNPDILSMFLGDDRTFVLPVYQSDGTTPYDLSGESLRFILENPETDAVVLMLDEAGNITRGGSNNEIAYVTVEASDLSTAGLVKGTYRWKLWGTSFVLRHGTIEILPGVRS
jgi:3',5'-cyclic AMP phosphodiesterase CpdA